MFFNIISIIGPINIPNTPMNLKPVYIAINVNIGCIPIFSLTILGSINCLTTDIIIHNINSAIPKFKFPVNAEIIAQGIIIVPDPNIGNASTNPIASADVNGYLTSSPMNLNIYSPN